MSVQRLNPSLTSVSSNVATQVSVVVSGAFLTLLRQCPKQHESAYMKVFPLIKRQHDNMHV